MAGPVPPAAAQLPAGLVDGGETAAEAAVRELREETGYSGTVGRVSTVCHSDPGMTGPPPPRLPASASRRRAPRPRPRLTMHTLDATLRAPAQEDGSAGSGRRFFVKADGLAHEDSCVQVCGGSRSPNGEGTATGVTPPSVRKRGADRGALAA